MKTQRISIPTETMEQEFQAHYQRGFESGKKHANAELARVKEELAEMRKEVERWKWRWNIEIVRTAGVVADPPD